MLLQEHVAERVSTRIPDSWEEDMLRAEDVGGRRKNGRRKRRPREDSGEEQLAGSVDSNDAEQTDEQTYVPSDEEASQAEK